MRAQFADRILAPIHQQVYDDENAVEILDEDWDNLFILDACRTDLFEQTANLDQFDSYGTRQSKASGTREWAQKNFNGDAASDVIYINASPVVSREIGTAVGRFIEVWKNDFNTEIATVPPEKVAEAAIEAAKEHPEMRLIVHFMQPHYPFIGYPDLRFTSFQGTDEIELDVSGKADNVWDGLALNLVDSEQCWEGYESNLETVLEVALPLAESLDGKTVLTSDHGNLFGEYPAGSPLKIYGHPNGVYHKNLRCVPWAVINKDSEPTESTQEQSIDRDDQLKALGYT